MPLYRYTIIPRGAFGTPMRSDTLHGQLLCAAAELDGGEAVAGLIAAFDSDSPPFVCSSAFPAGMLPMPCLPPIARSDFLAHFGSRGGLFLGDKALALKAYKKFRKIEQVPIGIWTELRASLSQTKLFRRWYQEWGQDANAFRPKPAPFENTWRTGHVEAHNSIDRATGSVLQEGGLFLSDSTFYGSGIRLDLYVQTDAPDGFERLLRHVAATGFGRDASTGKGWFDFTRDEAFTPGELDGDGSHRMSLSVLSAMNLSEASGWYRVFAKSGRAGGALGQANPFKKTFLAMEEGSVFKSLPASGYVLRGLHPDSRVVQVTWPLTIAFTPAKEDTI